MRADEVFLVGTTIDVLPVVYVDGQKINNGIPGPMTSALQQRFTELVAHLGSLIPNRRIWKVSRIREGSSLPFEQEKQA